MQRIDVPVGWQTEPLRKLGKFIKSKGGPKADESEDGVPVVRYGELYTKHDDVIRSFHSFVPPEVAEQRYTRLHVGDVLFAGSGETLEEIGKSAAFLGPEPAYGSGDIVIFRPGRALDPRFVGYASNGPDAVRHKSRTGQGSSVMHIYTHNLEKLHLSVPPLSEQKKIAAILSSVDEAIQATQAVIEQTRRVKEGLLQDLLTRGIGQGGRPHTRFKQTEIGEIPESWEIRRVDQVCRVTSGATPLRSNQAYFDSGDVPWVKTMDLNGGVVSTTDESITPLALAETSCKVLPVGTVMCAMYGGFRQIGRTGVLAMEAATNQAISSMVLKPKAKLLPEFLNYFFVAHRPRWKGIAASSRKDPNITRQDVCGFKVAVPPVAEQHAIVDRVDALTAAVGEGEVALAAHRRVKAGLLQDLLTGKVRVSV